MNFMKFLFRLLLAICTLTGVPSVTQSMALPHAIKAPGSCDDSCSDRSDVFGNMTQSSGSSSHEDRVQNDDDFSDRSDAFGNTAQLNGSSSHEDTIQKRSPLEPQNKSVNQLLKHVNDAVRKNDVNKLHTLLITAIQEIDLATA